MRAASSALVRRFVQVHLYAIVVVVRPPRTSLFEDIDVCAAGAAGLLDGHTGDLSVVEPATSHAENVGVARQRAATAQNNND